MRLLLALLLPFSVFFTIGRPFAGLLCLLLQITLIGWVPAAIWAVYALSQYKTDQKIKEALGGRCYVCTPKTPIKKERKALLFYGGGGVQRMCC